MPCLSPRWMLARLPAVRPSAIPADAAEETPGETPAVAQAIDEPKADGAPLPVPEWDHA